MSHKGNSVKAARNQAKLRLANAFFGGLQSAAANVKLMIT